MSISSPCRKDQFSVFTFHLKVCSDPGLRKIRHSLLVCRCGFVVLIVFSYKHLLTMVACYGMTTTITRSTMTGHLFDTIIVASTDKEWKY